MNNSHVHASKSASYSEGEPWNYEPLSFHPVLGTGGGAVESGNTFASACERVQTALMWFMETMASKSSAPEPESGVTSSKAPVRRLEPTHKSKCWQDRLDHVAANPKTPVDVLERLTYHPEPEVRVALAENKNVPLRCIWTLAHDRDPDVRYQLAENHKLPMRVLMVLAEDDNPYVACRARTTLGRLLGI
jgi:hypothetical protein